jgi:hypothetical protein
MPIWLRHERERHVETCFRAGTTQVCAIDARTMRNDTKANSVDDNNCFVAGCCLFTIIEAA